MKNLLPLCFIVLMTYYMRLQLAAAAASAMYWQKICFPDACMLVNGVLKVYCVVHNCMIYTAAVPDGA